MRHIHAETSLPPERSTDSSLSQPSGEAPLEPSSQHCAHHSILMGYKTEIKRQKVYQVSIFSHLSSSSESMEQRAGSRAAKRSYPEQRTLERGRDPKRTHWGGRGVDSKCDGGPGQASLDDDDTFEDGLLVEELSLYGSAQHFSHSGLRVVEHRCEGSPSHSPKASREDKLQDVSSSSWPQHIACSTLHMRDSCPVSLGDQHPDYGENGEQASGHNLLHLDLHSIAQTAQLGSDGKEKPGSSPAHNSRASGEEEQPVVSNGCREPPASQTALSPKPGNLSSLEKMPCGSSQLSSSSSCKAKRKLLPAGDVVTDSEDESLSPWARKKRVLPCHMAATACRSTDAKGAPFWNHLLPKAQSFADCSAVERRLKSGLHLKSRHLRSRLWRGTRSSAAPWATTTVSHALLGNFEESILKGCFAPSGRIEGFTAEIGASGSYCPQHVTLPVDVTYFDISEHSMPSPFLGVIDLEALGKKGYSVPKAGTIQVTLFNPNKTVVKMFLVTYDFEDMPANHITFLRHRIFLVPVGEEEQAVVATHNPPGAGPPRKVLCYLMHLRFHSSKSGKIYLHNDIRMLFSRKSIEVDSGIPYELKSFTEMPRNPCYSPRA
ncbi:protein FAM214B isoform X1 [Falco rusticolus]|uniref:atos homolog protein B isoform X1 n=1 Tax=Falco cherrug TaxID=345164 RepID=UPI000392F4F8|nr:atos homolog protein B isoform X1 [Falco cherrug]XP_037230080.1 protein FAM214B isoform X1 [Falco rusticolus]XP_037230081.1 protein FAM214B isoform X1 [Falco rusticolus]XP_037230083.1 protein FAM214B isoform X1 [Falco rusticolus]XP_037230084.1 protein FAM214B isoform X1 [Falco rusticolus]XP_037230085.1 protein FAM214B isoform X1 [Falco rusticolus]XP_055555320.1 atos homolog protein B isoform X1 [Falco cherrug]XP_055555321.1 atos homolog protein B isoform X1 [Falco cherrug]XP_055555322.1 